MKKETIINSTHFNGSDYFISIETIFVPSQVMSFIRLKISKEEENKNDLLVAKVISSIKNIEGEFGICRNKEIIDNARTIIGCGSVIGSAICATMIATPVGLSPIALVCEAIWDVAIAKGAEDCITSSLGAISEILGNEKEFKALEMLVNINENNRTEIFLNLLDKMCSDIKQNKSNESDSSSQVVVQKPNNDNKGENDLSSKASDKFIKNAEKPAEKPADKPVDKPVDKPADKPAAIKENGASLAGGNDKGHELNREPAGFFDGPNK